MDINAEDVTPVGKAVAVNFPNFDNAANVASLSPATKIQPEPSNSEQQKTATRTTARKENTQLTGINIKIPLSQRQWLANTARQVRQNSAKPVPPSSRVYPHNISLVSPSIYFKIVTLTVQQHTAIAWNKMKYLPPSTSKLAVISINTEIEQKFATA
jgi:hypothetical protein